MKTVRPLIETQTMPVPAERGGWGTVVAITAGVTAVKVIGALQAP
ncbi:MAG: hypothetical protein ACOCUP_03495 [bacterium]